MKRTSHCLISRTLPLAVPVVALLLAGAAQTATASSADPDTGGKGQPAAVAADQQVQSAKRPDLAPAAALSGYQQVSSAVLTDAAGAQSSGSVSCPSGTRLVGGGAVILSSSLSENLNSSYPSTNGSTWVVFVNNSTTTPGTFTVFADCVKKVSKYSVVAGVAVDNPSGLQTQATVTCPRGTVPLGGGGFASSGSLAVNLNSTFPLSKGWRTDVNNNTTTSNSATAYAICGKKPTGYAQVAGTPVTVGASSQVPAVANCPSGTVVLGGGSLSSSASPAVDLNSTSPFGSAGWRSYENNGTQSSSTLTAYAVCSAAS